MGLISCDKQRSGDGSSTNSPAQATPFKGEIYRMINDQQIITFVSPSELELQVQGTNLIGKYTKQDENLRVVINFRGSDQALYYKITPQGLRANDGTMLLSPSEYTKTVNAIQLAKQREEENIKRINLVIAQSCEQTKEIAVIDMSSVGHFASEFSPYKCIITDVSVGLLYPENAKPSCKVNFVDFYAIRPVETQQSAGLPKGFLFSLTWQKRGVPNCSGGQYMVFKEKAEAEQCRETLINAFAVWSKKFPEAAPKVDYNEFR